MISGTHVEDVSNHRLLFPPAPLSVSIYDSYIQLYDKGTLPVKGNIHVEFNGIIPFTGMVPLKKILGKFPPDFWEQNKEVTIEEYFLINEDKSFQLVFDPKYGWEKIPRFFEPEDENYKKMVIKHNSEYEASLNRNFIGPYVFVDMIFEEDVGKFSDVIKVLKSLNFANPPRNVNGKILMSDIKPGKPRE